MENPERFLRHCFGLYGSETIKYVRTDEEEKGILPRIADISVEFFKEITKDTSNINFDLWFDHPRVRRKMGDSWHSVYDLPAFYYSLLEKLTEDEAIIKHWQNDDFRKVLCSGLAYDIIRPARYYFEKQIWPEKTKAKFNKSVREYEEKESLENE